MITKETSTLSREVTDPFPDNKFVLSEHFPVKDSLNER